MKDFINDCLLFKGDWFAKIVGILVYLNLIGLLVMIFLPST